MFVHHLAQEGSFSPLGAVPKLRACTGALNIESPKAAQGQDTGIARRGAEGYVWWYTALQELWYTYTFLPRTS